MEHKPGMYDTYPHAIKGIIVAFAAMFAVVSVVAGALYAACQAFGHIEVCQNNPEATAAMLVSAPFAVAFGVMGARKNSKSNTAACVVFCAIFATLTLRSIMTLAGY